MVYRHIRMKFLMLLSALFVVLNAEQKSSVPTNINRSTSLVSKKNLTTDSNNASSTVDYSWTSKRNLNTKVSVAYENQHLSAKNTFTNSQSTMSSRTSTTEEFSDQTTVEETTTECTTMETTTDRTTSKTTTDISTVETTTESITSETITDLSTIETTTDKRILTFTTNKTITNNIPDFQILSNSSKQITTSVPSTVQSIYTIKMANITSKNEKMLKGDTELGQQKATDLKIFKSVDKNSTSPTQIILLRKMHTKSPRIETEKFPSQVNRSLQQNISKENSSIEKYEIEYGKHSTNSKKLSAVEYQSSTHAASALTTETSVNSSHVHIEIDIDIGSHSINDSASNKTVKIAQKRMVAEILLIVLISISAICAILFVLSPSKGEMRQDRLQLLSSRGRSRAPRKYYDGSLYAEH